MDILSLNVSGKMFMIGKETLRRYPDTKLGRLTSDSTNYNAEKMEYFFDRNPKLIIPILDLYRTGELHLPSNVCTFTIKQELKFWEIREDLISECCWKKYESVASDMRAVDILEKSICNNPCDGLKKHSLKHMLWMNMEYASYSVAAKVWFTVYVMMIIVAVVTAVLSMSPEMRVNNDQLFPARNRTSILDMLLTTDIIRELYIIDLVCLQFFTVELLVRFTISPKKMTFMKEPLHILDLTLTGIMWLAVLFDHIPAVEHAQVAHTIMRALFCLNVLRVFHLGRTSNGLKLLLFTITSSMEAFGLLLVSLTMAVVIFATLGYFAEVASYADTFSSIPIALWWAVVTMTTVGYGDYYPQSWPGYMVGIMCALSGVLLLALPIAIIASNFNLFYSNMPSVAQRMRRKHFLYKLKTSSKSTGNQVLHNNLNIEDNADTIRTEINESIDSPATDAVEEITKQNGNIVNTDTLEGCMERL